MTQSSGEELLALTDLRDTIEVVQREATRRFRAATGATVIYTGLLGLLVGANWEQASQSAIAFLVVVLLIVLGAMWGRWLPVSGELKQLRAQLKDQESEVA